MSLRQSRRKTRKPSIGRQAAVLGFCGFALFGCEARSLYGIELVGFDDAESGPIIENDDFSLHALVGNHPDAPGITLIALSNNWPTEPQWSWKEFESWSPDKKASMFGRFYDQKYLDLSISHTLTCPLKAESFDHREGAQEAAYGQWLHGLPSDVIGLHPKGTSVSVPIAGCDSRAKAPAGDIEELTVTVDSGRAEGPQQVKIRFRVYLVDKEIHWLF